MLRWTDSLGSSMRNEDLKYLFKDMSGWAEPIIADQIHGFYGNHLKNNGAQTNQAIVQHRLFWRYLLAGQDKLALHARRELQNKARSQGIAMDILNEVDHLILDELMNVTMLRFHRSPANVRNYGRTFIEIASQLAQTRLAAA